MFSAPINFYQSSTQAVAVGFLGHNNVAGRMLVLSFAQNSFVKFEGPFFHVKIESPLFPFSILIIKAHAWLIMIYCKINKT
jgi:hypothetical protein